VIPAAEPNVGKLPLPEIVSERRRWFAIHTASNNEKKVRQHLQAKEIETFLPVYGVTKRWKNRTTVRVELPLFAGYVFARFDPSERLRIVEVPMVYSIVGSRGKASAIADDEIDSLRNAVATRQVHPFPYVKVGNRVRIRSGPLTGLEGTVVRSGESLSVVLTVEMIQKSVAVHVEADELEPCPNA